MRINEHTSVFTTKVQLVPYSAHHVPKYHEWMKDPDIQEATASEPLSLDEEYAMQRSWRADPDKLTFIICHPNAEVQSSGRDGLLDHDSMIGDVNLFISSSEDEAGSELIIGELELMIAERTDQGRGYGRAAILAFLNYINRHETELLAEFQASVVNATVRFDHFAAKIGATNSRSVALFESLGFTKTSEVPSYFGEFELRLPREAVVDLMVRAKDFVAGYGEIPYISP